MSPSLAAADTFWPNPPRRLQAMWRGAGLPNKSGGGQGVQGGASEKHEARAIASGLCSGNPEAGPGPEALMMCCSATINPMDIEIADKDGPLGNEYAYSHEVGCAEDSPAS